VRKPPARFNGLGKAFKADTVNTHYRIEYLKLIVVAIQQLDDRLLNCPGLIQYCELEVILLSGNINESVIPLYSELIAPTRGSFQSQLDVFLSLPEIAQITRQLTLEMCTRVLRNMVPAMRAMFPRVESLIRLLLVNPASSATAERSFSSLRRLENYMHSTCSEQRLINIALCHVHKYIMNAIVVIELMKKFVLARDNRAAFFGQIVLTDCQY